jgi:hypothetical protein
MGNLEDIVELKDQASEFQKNIHDIKVDVAIIKEKYNHMNDRVLKIDENFSELVSTVYTMRNENTEQHKSMIKALIAASATISASFIGAIGLIISVLL